LHALGKFARATGGSYFGVDAASDEFRNDSAATRLRIYLYYLRRNAQLAALTGIMAHNETLAAAIREHFRRHRVTYEEKRMMGGLCFMVRDRMCVGVYRDQLMVRLDPAGRTAALQRRGCAPMEFTGRPLRGFVLDSSEGWADQRDFDHWLTLAKDFNPQAVSSKKKRLKAGPVGRNSTGSRATKK